MGRFEFDPARRKFLGDITLATAGVVGAAVVGKKVWDFSSQPDVHARLRQLESRELPSFPEFEAPAREQNVAVMLLKNPEDPELQANARADSYDPETKQYTVIHGMQAILDDVKKAFSHHSRGQLNYNFTLLPWYNMERPIEVKDTNLEQIANLGEELFQASDIPNKDIYQTRLYVMPGKNGAIGGWGKSGQAWVYSDPAFDNTLDSLQRVIGHELGHTLGQPHVHGLRSEDLGQGRKIETEYANTSSTLMGNCKNGDFTEFLNAKKPRWAQSGIPGFTVPEQIALGWVEREQVEDVTRSGIYEITYIDSDNNLNGAIALRLRKPDTNEFYYLTSEFYPGLQREEGFLNKVNYAIWDEKRDSSTYLFEPRGHSFYDQKNGIRFRDLGYDRGKSRVEIVFDK